MKCKISIFLGVLLTSLSSFAAPLIRSVDGEPEQGETLLLDATSLAVLPTLRVFFCDNATYNLCNTSVEQEVLSRGGWTGPIEIRADFSGFNDGDTVYVIPSNGDPDEEAAYIGEPIVFGHPKISALEFSGTETYRATVLGTGFTSDSNSAAIHLANASTWEDSSLRVEQSISTWESQAITFEVDLSGLEDLSPIYVFVTDDDGDRNLTGFEFWPHRPTIANVIRDNQSLTIQGNHFKRRGGEQIIFDDFEDGSNGSKVSDIPGTQWRDYHAGGVITNSRAYSGSLCATGSTETGETNSTFATNDLQYDASNDVFISYMLAFQTDYPEDVNGVWKFSRVNSDHEEAGTYNGPGDMGMGQSTTPWPNTTSTYFNNGAQGGHSPGSVSDFPAYDGTFSRIEMHKVLSTPGIPDGRVYFRVNQSSAFDITAMTRATGFDFQMNSTILGLMLANFEHEIHVFIDDYYAATTLARVILSDTQDYTQATQFSIQSVSSWDDEEISVDINLGAFDNIFNLYLTVIDQYGNVSYGYPLVSNGSGGLVADNSAGGFSAPSSSGCQNTSATGAGVLLSLLLWIFQIRRRRLPSPHGETNAGVSCK